MESISESILEEIEIFKQLHALLPKLSDAGKQYILDCHFTRIEMQRAVENKTRKESYDSQPRQFPQR